jgi:hypothetical protein
MGRLGDRGIVSMYAAPVAPRALAAGLTDEQVDAAFDDVEGLPASCGSPTARWRWRRRPRAPERHRRPPRATSTCSLPGTAVMALWVAFEDGWLARVRSACGWSMRRATLVAELRIVK